jgi:hypothetical protein
MLDNMANYATIILMLAMVNVVWQLDKASRLVKEMSRILKEGFSNE